MSRQPIARDVREEDFEREQQPTSMTSWDWVDPEKLREQAKALREVAIFCRRQEERSGFTFASLWQEKALEFEREAAWMERRAAGREEINGRKDRRLG